MARRSIWQRLLGRIERQRAIREHERVERELLGTLAGELLAEENRAAVVKRFLPTSTHLVLPESPAARLERWCRIHPAWKERAVDEAREALSGELSLFGKNYPIRSPDDWHQDPDGLRQWLQIPHMRIRLDDPTRPGDVRMQWEPARFHHALRLGRAYLATGRDDYPAAFLRQVDLFEMGNRPFESIHWAVGMEVAIRAVNWLFAVEFFRKSDLFTEERCRQLVHLLMLHGLFLENHIEIHQAGPTNHTVADYAGLAVLASAFAGTTIGTRWREIVAREFHECLAAQILEGGAHSECSLFYERFVLEASLVVFSQLPSDQRDQLRGPLLSLAKHLRGVCISNRLPHVGDGDDSFFPPFGLRPFDDLDPQDPEPVLQLAALHLGADELRSREETAEEAFWLGVPETAIAKAPSTPGTLRIGGFVRFVAGPFQGLVVTRDRKEGWIPTHSHNDLLSLVLEVGGTPLLIDPGTGGYAWDRKLRHLLRSTASHSTLQVDGIEQSLIRVGVTFEAPHAIPCEVEHLSSEPFAIRARCEWSTGGYVHARSIDWRDGLLWIEDRLSATDAEREGSVRKSFVRFLFAPGLKPVQDRSRQSIYGVETPTGTVRFLFLHPKAADWQSLTVPASQRYGSREMVASLAGSFNGRLNHRWVTLIAPPDWSVEELTAFADEAATEGK